jgi:hypothetical protein
LLNSLLGTLSSGVAASTSSYESIASATGTGSSGTITFSSIPSTYKHLQVRCFANDGAGYSVKMTFNNDTATNYAFHSITGTGAAVNASGQATQDHIRIMNENGSTSNTNSAIIVDIIDYASTTKAKTARVFNGLDKNGSGEVELRSGLWTSTAAVNRLDIVIGGSFTTTSTFALYGIKG